MTQHSWSRESLGVKIEYKTDTQGYGVMYRTGTEWLVLKNPAGFLPINVNDMNSEAREEYFQQVADKYGEAIAMEIE